VRYLDIGTKHFRTQEGVSVSQVPRMACRDRTAAFVKYRYRSPAEASTFPSCLPMQRSYKIRAAPESFFVLRVLFGCATWNHLLSVVNFFP